MSEMLKNLKAVLSEIIKDSSKIFIVGHNEPDFDSISSAIGLWTICQMLGRKAYIIVDDDNNSLEPGVRRIINENRQKFNIINLATFDQLIDKNSSLIITDTNKDYLLSVKDYLEYFKYKIIIDHHAEDQHTIESDYSFIDQHASSASEMVAQVLNSYRLHYDKDVANYLLAGIQLDTNRYSNNTSSKTHNVAEKLIEHGASPSAVSKMFRSEFETDRRINNLIYNGSLFETYERNIFQIRQVSFTLNRSLPHMIYKKEDLAKAADKMLDYNIDAAFVIGYVKEDLVSISARSKSDINAGSIMGKLGGGGNATSGACKILTPDIEEVEEQLRKIVSEAIKGGNESIMAGITVESSFQETISKENFTKVKV